LELACAMSVPAELLPVTQNPDNRTCADCGSKHPRWASVTLGVLVCIDCATIHRKVGTHITSVKSLTLDTWKPEWVKRVKLVGNRIGRDFYEHRLRASEPRPSHADESTKEEKKAALEEWIRNKYERLRWTPFGGVSPARLVDEGKNPDIYSKAAKQAASAGLKMPLGDKSPGSSGSLETTASVQPTADLPPFQAFCDDFANFDLHSPEVASSGAGDQGIVATHEVPTSTPLAAPPSQVDTLLTNLSSLYGASQQQQQQAQLWKPWTPPAQSKLPDPFDQSLEAAAPLPDALGDLNPFTTFAKAH